MRGAPPKGDVMPFVQRAFETIAFATVSTSAAHAKELLYLREYDDTTMNRERLMADAKSGDVGFDIEDLRAHGVLVGARVLAFAAGNGAEHPR